MLEGLNVKSKILNWSGRSYRMSPGGPKPFHAASVVRVLSEGNQGIKHIIQAHVAQAVKQSTGVLKHNARLLSLVYKCRDKFPHALVTPVKHRGVVVVPNMRVVHHVLQIANNVRSSKVVPARWNERLVHVKGTCKAGTNATEVDSTGNVQRCARSSHHGLNDFLTSRNIQNTVYVLRQGINHGRILATLPILRAHVKIRPKTLRKVRRARREAAIL